MVKGASTILSLIIVNVYLNYLGSFQYGVWLTITSIASWVAMGDLGIGNGLRNELAKAYAEKDTKKQENLINASNIAFVRLSAIIFCILSVVSEIMIHTGVLSSEVRLPLYITNFFTCINFATGSLGAVANAYQYGYVSAGVSTFFTGVSILLVAILSVRGKAENLNTLAVITGMAGISSSAIMYVILKKKTGLRFFFRGKTDHEAFQKVITVGIQFFVLQLCSLILYSTDNVIINSLFGGEEVTRYSIITKVYNTGDTLFSILLVSLWSAVTYQYSLGNYRWIVEKTKKILSYWLLYSLGVIVVSFGFNLLVRIWLRENAMAYDPLIIGVFALYSIAGTFGSVFVNISNGMGIIKLQMIMSAVEAALNIPLSVILARSFGLGITGVKIATLLCCTGANIVMPVYITGILRKRIHEQEPIQR